MMISWSKGILKPPLPFKLLYYVCSIKERWILPADCFNAFKNVLVSVYLGQKFAVPFTTLIHSSLAYTFSTLCLRNKGRMGVAQLWDCKIGIKDQDLNPGSGRILTSSMWE